MELLRTLLFVPGNRPSMIEKACSLPADVIVPDLEDSVPLAEKGTAREVVKKLLPRLMQEGQRVMVRINSLSSGLAADDLEQVMGQGLSGITMPKAESAQDVARVVALIEAWERERGLEVGQTKLVPWVETAKGVLRAFEIASSSPRVIGIAFGADDYTLDMGVVRSKGQTELFHVRSQIAIAARAAEVAALDTPYVDFRDEQGLVQDTALSRQLGFKGRFLIHPSQIEPVNRIFRPSVEEVEQARRVVEAFAEAERSGSAATSVDGRMVDVPVAKRARNLLLLAEAIADKESRDR